MREKIYTGTYAFRKPSEKNLITITGMTRSGKAYLAPMVCSFKGAERLLMDGVFEQFPYLHSIGGLSDESAVYLLRYAFDKMSYESMIGRNTNFRVDDFSSVWKTDDPEKYFVRLFAPDRDIVFEKIKKENPLFVFFLHNSLMHADILFKAFPSIKMLQMVRHPADLAHSWYLKGYGHDFWENPRVANLTIKWKKHILPYYVHGWEKEYINYSEMDRIINMITRIMSREIEGFESLSSKYKKQVLVIPFEGLVSGPKECLKKICNFLSADQTLYTPITIQKEQERFPLLLNKQERKKKRDVIKKLSSESAYRLLEDLIAKYESTNGVY